MKTDHENIKSMLKYTFTLSLQYSRETQITTFQSSLIVWILEFKEEYLLDDILRHQKKNFLDLDTVFLPE